MSDAIDLLHARSSMDRRAAIVMAWFALALLIIATIIAEHEHAWRASIVGGFAGAALMGAYRTYAQSRLWERVAAERQAGGA